MRRGTRERARDEEKNPRRKARPWIKERVMRFAKFLAGLPWVVSERRRESGDVLYARAGCKLLYTLREVFEVGRGAHASAFYTSVCNLIFGLERFTENERWIFQRIAEFACFSKMKLENVKFYEARWDCGLYFFKALV